MTNHWQAQCIIEPEKALELIKSQFPELNASTISLFGSGWDNTAYLINDEYIFRFPRREVAVNLIMHEMFALPLLTDKLPLAIPNPQWHGKPDLEYPWPFIGYHMLRGKTACSINLSDEQRGEFVEPLALFLKTLHSIPIKEFKDILPGDVIDRLNVTVRIPKTLVFMQELETLKLLPNKNILHDLIKNSKDLPIPQEKVICHGDVYIRHLLINDQNELTGIIDWGDIHFNSPSADLSVMYSFLPPDFHNQFKKIYGYLSPETWELARFRAVVQCLNFIMAGHNIGDGIIEREGERGLNYIAASSFRK